MWGEGLELLCLSPRVHVSPETSLATKALLRSFQFGENASWNAFYSISLSASN